MQITETGSAGIYAKRVDKLSFFTLDTEYNTNVHGLDISIEDIDATIDTLIQMKKETQE